MHIIITGANRGIGHGLLSALTERGDTVTGTARQAAAGLLPLDVTDPGSVRAMATALEDTPVDLLVCNAGIYIDKGHSIDTGYPPDAWAETFAVNVTGVFLTIQSLLPNLRAAGGKIAILSSVMASDERAPGGSYIYRASKAAVLNLGRNLAVALRSDRIAVGMYHPGWVRTDVGGAGADIDTSEAVSGLIARFDALSLESTGCFEDYAGRPIPF